MDTAAARVSLRSRIWVGGSAYPTAGVTRWVMGTTGPSGPSPSNLASIDRGEIDIYDAASTLRATAIVYVWHPASPTGQLALHCTGHSGSYVSGLEDAVDALVDAGITVVGLQLPPGGDPAHNALPMPTSAWNPLALFCEPAIRVLNEMAASYSVGPICMCGLSGGGWTTHVAMALDQRIARGFAVAGSLPLWSKMTGAGLRDYEQYLHGTGFDYPHLYVMAADEGRRLIHALNDGDTCCFNRVNYAELPQKYYGFERTVAAAAKGHYELWWTGDYGHIISAKALARMISEFSS